MRRPLFGSKRFYSSRFKARRIFFPMTIASDKVDESSTDEVDPAFIDSTVVDAEVVDAGGAKPSFHLGGQALIEGVMMRSPHYIAASVRRADGTIETRVEEFHSILQRHRWMQIPFVRGSVALIEMMVMGTRFLNWSGQVAMQDTTPTPDDPTPNASPSDASPMNVSSPEASTSLGDAPPTSGTS